MRDCTRCLETKPSTEYYRDKNKPGGFEYTCKLCREESRTPGYVRKMHGGRSCDHCGVSYDPSTWKQRWCTACVPKKCEHSRKIMKNYDLSRPEWDAMYFDQDGKCAVSSCENEATHVDHCHTTGKVRALLCNGCNYKLGFIEDPRWITAAFDYLADHKPRW